VKVVLDANVVIAAFATRGLCVDVFEYCVKTHEIYLSEQLLGEIQKAFIKKIKMASNVASVNTQFVKSVSLLEKPIEVPAHLCRDPKDLPVIGLAAAVKADYLISGDNDLLLIKSYQKTRIVSPRNFWEMTLKKDASPS
jgi:putative PIN family toxin of toxin-antitoxin system